MNRRKDHITSENIQNIKQLLWNKSKVLENTASEISNKQKPKVIARGMDDYREYFARHCTLNLQISFQTYNISTNVNRSPSPTSCFTAPNMTPSTLFNITLQGSAPSSTPRPRRALSLQPPHNEAYAEVSADDSWNEAADDLISRNPLYSPGTWKVLGRYVGDSGASAHLNEGMSACSLWQGT